MDMLKHLILILIIDLAWANQRRHTIVELRHDCSGPEHDPSFQRELWTSLVFRLKQPVLPQCEDELDRTFVWRFKLTQQDQCRGLLGCHYTNEMESGLSIQDIIYQVIARKNPAGQARSRKRRRKKRRIVRKRQAEDEFVIKRGRNRYFWNLVKGDELEMRIKYTSMEAASRQFPITCFAWCNKDMEDTAPLREDNSISAIIAPQLINDLVNPYTVFP